MLVKPTSNKWLSESAAQTWTSVAKIQRIHRHVVNQAQVMKLTRPIGLGNVETSADFKIYKFTGC